MSGENIGIMKWKDLDQEIKYSVYFLLVISVVLTIICSIIAQVSNFSDYCDNGHFQTATILCGWIGLPIGKLLSFAFVLVLFFSLFIRLFIYSFAYLFIE